MTKREKQYLKIKQLTKLAGKQNGCMEFPHFGARYPDAQCIDGYLWDLDSYEDGFLTSGGDDPCPVCKTRAYIQYMLECDQSIYRVERHLIFIFKQYGQTR